MVPAINLEAKGLRHMFPWQTKVMLRALRIALTARLRIHHRNAVRFLIRAKALSRKNSARSATAGAGSLNCRVSLRSRQERTLKTSDATNLSGFVRRVGSLRLAFMFPRSHCRSLLQ